MRPPIRRLLLILLLIACAGCATMDPATKRALGVGAALGWIAWGIAAIASGDVVDGAALLGGEVLGLSVNAAGNLPVGDSQPVPPQTLVSER
jgi:hypothetical protein